MNALDTTLVKMALASFWQRDVWLWSSNLR